MSKSRSGKNSSNSQNAPPGPTQNAIIPGKFYESDWLELIEIEEDENFIADIIDEVTDAVLDQVFNKIVQSRVLPHTVLSTRSLLLDILDWQFLESDPGEVDTVEQLSWSEDNEPLNCAINNWAQGAVPVDILAPIQEPESQKDDILGEFSIDGNFSEQECDVTATSSKSEGDGFIEELENLHIDDAEVNTSEVELVELSSKLSSIEITSITGEVEGDSFVDNTIGRSPKRSSEAKQKGKKYRPHVGKLADFGNISLNSVTDLRPKPGTRPSLETQSFQKTELTIKNHYGRASGPKEVVYDDKGKVLKVEKLNVANFPTHRVPVKYSILDPEKNTENKRLKASPKIGNSKKFNSPSEINPTTLLNKIDSNTSWNKSYGIDANGNEIGYPSLAMRSPLPPLLVDSINVADGVIVREGGLSKQVLKKSMVEKNSVKSLSVFPINSSANRVLDVKDIVSETSPSFRFVAT